MGNCANCDNKLVKFSDLGRLEDGMVQVYGNMYVKCLGGNNEIIQEFFKENGKKTSKEVAKIKVDCYKPTKIDLLLDSAIDKADKILDKMDG